MAEIPGGLTISLLTVWTTFDGLFFFGSLHLDGYYFIIHGCQKLQSRSARRSQSLMVSDEQILGCIALSALELSDEGILDGTDNL